MAVVVRAPVLSAGTVRIEVPAGKSEVLRALAAFALRGRGAVLRRGADADDVKTFVGGLRALGAEIEADAAAIVVRRGISRSRTEPATIRVEDGAAPARFLMALAATCRRPVRLETGARLAARPFAPLAAALRELGASIASDRGDDAPPFTVRGPMHGGMIEAAPAAESSQFLSALLLAAPACGEPCELACEGPFVSSGYVDLTVRALRSAGARVRADGGWWLVETGFHGGEETVAAPPDWSGAAPMLAAAAFLGRAVLVRGLSLAQTHPDAKFVGIARGLGLDLIENDEGATCAGRPTCGGEIDVGDCPDLAPTLAALGTLAPGGVVLRGAPHLRLKESDRIASLVVLLQAAGVRAEERADGLLVPGAFADVDVGAPARRDASPFDAPCARDHRLVQAAALLGLARPARIDDASCVGKSFPGFFDVFPGDVAREESHAR
jgi:3-phosphoshikimate 1-carboxyvinyltransferase